MKRVIVSIMTAAVLVATARTAMAQATSVTPHMRTETATIEAIEASTRTITLKKPDGTYVTTVAGPEVKRFPELKIGDKVNARYYENVVMRLKQPGEPDVDKGGKTVNTPSDMAMPGGTKAKQRTITATITAIDMDKPEVSFSGPNGWKYTSMARDKEALAKVKVGDKVDVVFTEAMLVSVEPGK